MSDKYKSEFISIVSNLKVVAVMAPVMMLATCGQAVMETSDRVNSSAHSFIDNIPFLDFLHDHWAFIFSSLVYFMVVRVFIFPPKSNVKPKSDY
ncbi:hypothetical protein K9692_004702 [Escherichia coli]|jgi:hypothetical protein|nr:hypothetical protein [Escherichia coli]